MLKINLESLYNKRISRRNLASVLLAVTLLTSGCIGNIVGPDRGGGLDAYKVTTQDVPPPPANGTITGATEVTDVPEVETALQEAYEDGTATVDLSPDEYDRVTRELKPLPRGNGGIYVRYRNTTFRLEILKDL